MKELSSAYLPSPVESRDWLLQDPHSTRRRTSQLRYPGERFPPLVCMPKLKEGDTTPDPQTRCNGFVEGMAYKRENWAPVCNEVRFREDRSEGGEGNSRGVATGFSVECYGLRQRRRPRSGRKGGRPFIEFIQWRDFRWTMVLTAQITAVYDLARMEPRAADQARLPASRRPAPLIILTDTRT